MQKNFGKLYGKFCWKILLVVQHREGQCLVNSGNVHSELTEQHNGVNSGV